MQRPFRFADRNRRIQGSAPMVAAALAAIASVPAGAAVHVEWRPVANPVCVGDTVEVGLYFRSTFSDANEYFIAADVGFYWDQTKLRFLGIDNTGSLGGGSNVRQSVILYPDMTCQLNEANPPADGTGFYNLLGPNTGSLTATPAGSRVTRFRFQAIAPGSLDVGTQFLMGLCFTKVYDEEIPALNIIEPTQQAYGHVTVTVESCQPEACCLPNGSCQSLTADECTAQSGTPQGAGTTCEAGTCATEACCLTDGSCIDLTLVNCAAESGTAQGAGTACATTTCASPCDCPGDMDGNLVLNGLDVDGFIDCLINGGSGCACADVNGSGAADFDDAAALADQLVAGAACP